MVEILSTPTNFLRVREEASTQSDEIARVTPGKKYVLLEEDEESDWVKIEYEEATEYEEAKSGWVSGEYVKKVEADSESESAQEQ